MIALVIYVPHEKVYNYNKDRMAFTMETGKLGRGVHFYSFSDVELYRSTPNLFILFCLLSSHCFQVRFVVTWNLFYKQIKRKKLREGIKIGFPERKGFHYPKDAFSLKSDTKI